MSGLSTRALAARLRAAKRWYVYLILCRNGAVYTGIARDVAARYAQHVAGVGARYTRANPPRRLLVKFACLNQSEAGRMEAAIKKLTAVDKRKLTDTVQPLNGRSTRGAFDAASARTGSIRCGGR